MNQKWYGKILCTFSNSKFFNRLLFSILSCGQQSRDLDGTAKTSKNHAIKCFFFNSKIVF